MLVAYANYMILSNDSKHQNIYENLKSRAQTNLPENWQPREWYKYYIDVAYNFVPKILFPEITIHLFSYFFK